MSHSDPASRRMVPDSTNTMHPMKNIAVQLIWASANLDMDIAGSFDMPIEIRPIIAKPATPFHIRSPEAKMVFARLRKAGDTETHIKRRKAIGTPMIRINVIHGRPGKATAM